MPGRDARIMEAARALFLAHGYDETSLDAIARAAGTAKKTLYRRYGDKGGLFFAVMATLTDRWLQVVNTARRAAPDLPSSLETLALDLAEASVRPEAVALQSAIIAAAPRFPEVAGAYEDGYRRALAAIEDLLVQAAARGEITLDRVPAREAAEHFVAMTHMVHRRSALLGQALPDAAARAGRARRAVRLLMDALRPEPIA